MEQKLTSGQGVRLMKPSIQFYQNYTGMLTIDISIQIYIPACRQPLHLVIYDQAVNEVP